MQLIIAPLVCIMSSYAASSPQVAASQPVITKEGIIVSLDAAFQVGWIAELSRAVTAKGDPNADAVRKSLRSSFTNTAFAVLEEPSRTTHDERLFGFHFDESSGWTGSGSPGDPYALRFDAINSYVKGYTQIELPELTLEAWAYVEGTGNSPQKGQNTRSATLIGNDFGKGGISLMITPAGSPLILCGTTFIPVPAETPLFRWQQLVAAFSRDKVRVFVNGELVCALPIKRSRQKDHLPMYMLGAARNEANDFVEADGLRGMIAIARVYNRALSAAEVLRNFEADRGRFNMASVAASEPVRSTPPASMPALPAPPARNCKWDYFNHPPFISGTGPTGWPSNARQAFDGYPSRIEQPYLRNCWRCEVKPDAPAEVTINYRRPVAVTRYVHWFCEPAAWKSAEILASDDGENWKSLQKFEDLPPDYPQVLAIDEPIVARQYKIVVKALASAAGTSLVTHEIETNYGATIGNVTTDPARVIQGEPFTLSVHLVDPDGPLEGAKLRVISAREEEHKRDLAMPQLSKGASATVTFDATARPAGLIPVQLGLYIGDTEVDRRTAMVRVSPKLAFRDVTPKGAVLRTVGAGHQEPITFKGDILNQGRLPAEHVKIVANDPFSPTTIQLGDLRSGQSAPFEFLSQSPPSALRAEAEGGLWSVCARPIVEVQSVPDTRYGWHSQDGTLFMAFQAGKTVTLSLFANGQLCPIRRESGGGSMPLVAAIPNGLLTVRGFDSGATLQFHANLFNDDPLQTPRSDLELHISVEKPRIMFRPHIDWYTVAHGPNYTALANGHNSATRMLCIETEDGGTLSVVPDTDNLTWGFTKDNEISLKLHIAAASGAGPRRLVSSPLAKQQAWRPIGDSPGHFTLTFAVRKGDWWDAYRHVVQDIFKFEQPRQWAMPITQMQMLTARFTLRPEVWSEKWQVVRSHPGIDFFYNFYGLTYNIPALYSWYLVSDDTSALDRAQKDVEFLLKMQEKTGYADGAWFSMYCVEGSPPKLVGRDQAFNRWLMPHATGTTAKTLLWYWEASGRKDGRVFAAAKRGCDWLLKTQRADGAWTYAFDLNGKPVSELSGAGQIWCTWALWKMHQYTGDDKYAVAARRSRDAFKKTFMDVHRYEGYWEDVSGAGGKVARSWEGYEPAIACLVFADMGDKELAIEAGKDTATWSWTRVTSTRQYETAYGQTTEQSLCGPSQAQSPMIAVGLHQIYELTGDKLWSDFSGAIKAINFAADPDQAYGMVATGGWDDPLTGVIGPPYDNTRPMVTPNNSRGDEYGRQVWNNWCTDQFAWLALEWLVREANVRAPQYVKIDPNTYRGTVLGAAGRVKMPEEKCDVQGIDHIDINWVGYQNDDRYMLLIMNHHEKTSVMVRPHEAHLGVYTRSPQLLVGRDNSYAEAKIVRRGVQYEVEIPENGTALLIWDRMR